MKPSGPRRLSVVIPVYGGEKTIARVVERVLRDLRTLRPEVVLVNDASPDGSHTVCLALWKRGRGRVKYLRLAKNSGEHNAVLAGLRACTGDRVLILDDDDQNEPADVHRMLARLEAEDLDVVFGHYAKKRHALWRNLGSAFNDLVANWMLGKPRDLYLCSFKVMNRFLVDELIKYEGPFPYIDGLILRSTRRVASVAVAHHARAEGKSSYTLTKLLRLWLAMFTNFSIVPLRVATVAGWLLAALAFLSGSLMAVMRLRDAWEVPGWTSLFVAVSFFSGVQLISLGLLGEYLGRLFLTANRHPQAAVRDHWE
ncbi:MAG: glycosyltransferase family 2 protein [Spirochaetes bacterium]|nr:glycosyltransferase family 2 protein [Spirochaetota bacterium]